MKLFAFEKSVGAVVFRRVGQDVKYLLLQYGEGRSHWSLPKGHTEGTESPEETLKREMKEETGISEYKIVDNFLGNISYPYIARREEKQYRMNIGRGIIIFKKVFFYLLETDSDKVQLSHEHSDYVWLNYAEALERITYSKDRNIFKKAHDFLESIAKPKKS